VSKICARGTDKALEKNIRSEVVGFNFLRVEQTVSGVKVTESR